jgi:hypothetical protein
MPQTQQAIEAFEAAGERFYQIVMDDMKAYCGELIAKINVLEAKVATLEAKNKRLSEALSKE